MKKSASNGALMGTCDCFTGMCVCALQSVTQVVRECVTRRVSPARYAQRAHGRWRILNGREVCVCEKQKQIEGTRGDRDTLVLCVHRYAVSRVCVMFQPKAHESL